jgi:hypothetical protein
MTQTHVQSVEESVAVQPVPSAGLSKDTPCNCSQSVPRSSRLYRDERVAINGPRSFAVHSDSISTTPRIPVA